MIAPNNYSKDVSGRWGDEDYGSATDGYDRAADFLYQIIIRSPEATLIFYNETYHPGRCVGWRPSWRFSGKVDHWSTYFTRRGLTFGKKGNACLPHSRKAFRLKNKRTDAQSKHIWIDPKF